MNSISQDPPCTLKKGYRVPDCGYLGYLEDRWRVKERFTFRTQDGRRAKRHPIIAITDVGPWGRIMREMILARIISYSHGCSYVQSLISDSKLNAQERSARWSDKAARNTRKLMPSNLEALRTALQSFSFSHDDDRFSEARIVRLTQRLEEEKQRLFPPLPKRDVRATRGGIMGHRPRSELLKTNSFV